MLLTSEDEVPRDGEGRRPPPSSLVASKRRRRAIAGDLDAIVGKALAVDPRDRYPSAAALAAELRRHLAGEAVEARPGRGYRLGRFITGHRLALAGLAAGLALVIGYVVTVTMQSQALTLPSAPVGTLATIDSDPAAFYATLAGVDCTTARGGRVEVTSTHNAADRAAGSFSGTASCTNPAGTESRWQGRFDHRGTIDQR